MTIPAYPSIRFKVINAHGSTQIVTGPAALVGIDVGVSGGTGELLSVYDGVGATNLLFTMEASTGRSFDTHELPLANGLYATLAGSGQPASVAIWYRA